MSDLVRTIAHATGQFGVGVGVGAIVDSVFPDPGADKGDKDLKELAMLSAEAVVQLVVDALLTGLMAKMIRRLGDEGFHDPHDGVTYTFALLQSQPSLNEKIRRVSRTIRAWFRQEEQSLGLSWLNGRQRGNAVSPNPNPSRSLKIEQLQAPMGPRS